MNFTHSITSKIPVNSQLTPTDHFILELPENEFILFRDRLYKNWKKGYKTTSNMCYIELKLIREYIVTDIDWGIYI